MNATADNTTGTPRKTLVVEDDRIARIALSKILQSMGQQVHTAATFTEGMSQLHTGIDCLLLDLMLPDGSGMDILRHIRMENLPIRVAVTTAVTDPQVLMLLQELRPDAIFHKPLHLPDIARWLLRP